MVGSGYPDLRDTSPHNLFPLVFDALVDGRVPHINGDDYPTPDGTCVRDYVHVSDLAVSHVAAAQALLAGQPLEPVYNLGSGTGLSVRQIMDAVARVTGIDFTPEVRERRPGDPAQIVATGELAARDLDWKMRHTVDEMVGLRLGGPPSRARTPASSIGGRSAAPEDRERQRLRSRKPSTQLSATFEARNLTPETPLSHCGENWHAGVTGTTLVQHRTSRVLRNLGRLRIQPARGHSHLPVTSPKEAT